MISSIEQTLWSSLKAQRSEGVRTNLDVIFKCVVTGALQRMLVRCNCLLILKNSKQLQLTIAAGADPRFYLGGGAPLRNYHFNDHFYGV